MPAGDRDRVAERGFRSLLVGLLRGEAEFALEPVEIRLLNACFGCLDLGERFANGREPFPDPAGFEARVGENERRGANNYRL